MKLDQVKAIVTGGASGMGRAFTLNFAAAGGSVLAVDVNADGLADVEAAATELPGAVTTLVANVSDEDAVVGMISTARERMGGLNVLVNNAGIFRDGLLVKTDRETGKVKRTMSLDHWNQVIAVDLTGPFLCTREFCASHIDHGEGGEAVVVNISSVARHGNRGQTNYSAAKAGLVADTKLWSLEMSKHNIRFGAIAPGLVETPILMGMPPQALEKLASGVPMKRIGTTDEIFAGVRFIVECGYFTGRCIDIDGGLVV